MAEGSKDTFFSNYEIIIVDYFEKYLEPVVLNEAIGNRNQIRQVRKINRSLKDEFNIKLDIIIKNQLQRFSNLGFKYVNFSHLKFFYKQEEYLLWQNHKLIPQNLIFEVPLYAIKESSTNNTYLLYADEINFFIENKEIPKSWVKRFLPLDYTKAIPRRADIFCVKQFDCNERIYDATKLLKQIGVGDIRHCYLNTEQDLFPIIKSSKKVNSYFGAYRHPSRFQIRTNALPIIAVKYDDERLNTEFHFSDFEYWYKKTNIKQNNLLC